MPIGQILGALLTMATLVVATRQGQFPDIAAFSAGASLAALTATAAGGGTTLAFASGTRETQNAVRVVRTVIVAPTILLIAILSSYLYANGTDLRVLPIMFGGLSVAFNNLGELESVQLQRRLKTPQIAGALAGSRALGFATVIMGIPFSGAMLSSAVSSLCLLAVSRRLADGGPTSARPSLPRAVKLAYRPNLMAITLLDVSINRAPFLVVPLIADGTNSGAFASLLSSQQSATAVLIAGIYTAMTVRSAATTDPPWISVVERWTVRITLVLSVLGVAATPLVLRLFNLHEVNEGGSWWWFFMLAVPFYVTNRRNQYQDVSASRTGSALWLLVRVFGGVVVTCVVGLFLHDTRVIAAGPLVGEALGLLGFVIFARGQRRVRMPSTGADG